MKSSPPFFLSILPLITPLNFTAFLLHHLTFTFWYLAGLIDFLFYIFANRLLPLLYILPFLHHSIASFCHTRWILYELLLHIDIVSINIPFCYAGRYLHRPLPSISITSINLPFYYIGRYSYRLLLSIGMMSINQSFCHWKRY